MSFPNYLNFSSTPNKFEFLNFDVRQAADLNWNVINFVSLYSSTGISNVQSIIRQGTSIVINLLNPMQGIITYLGPTGQLMSSVGILTGNQLKFSSPPTFSSGLGNLVLTS